MWLYLKIAYQPYSLMFQESECTLGGNFEIYCADFCLTISQPNSIDTFSILLNISRERHTF